MVSHKKIRDEWSSWMVDHLNNVDSETWQFDTRWRGDINRGSNHIRQATMGDPIRYFLLYHRNDERDSDEFEEMTAGGLHEETPHTFITELWLGYTDADQYANSSQKAWDEVIWGGEDNEPAAGELGLIPKIRQTGYIKMSSGRTLYIGQPTNVPDNILGLESGRGSVSAHYAQYQITLAANPTP